MGAVAVATAPFAFYIYFKFNFATILCISIEGAITPELWEESRKVSRTLK